MSAMSNAAIEMDEARDLSGIDLVECERDHLKEQVNELRSVLSTAGFLLALVKWESEVMQPSVDRAVARISEVLEKTAPKPTGE